MDLLLRTVELTRDADGFSRGTVGTVVEQFHDAVMIEFSDEDGVTLALPIVPYDGFKVR
jgi:hypothetical protein